MIPNATKHSATEPKDSKLGLDKPPCGEYNLGMILNRQGAEMPAITEPNQGLRRHKLMPATVRNALPALGSTDGQGDQAICVVKYFGRGRYTFYATEFDGEDTLYGYTISALGSDCDEWGYASLREMAEATWGGYMRIPSVERDCYWTPMSVGEAVEARA